MGAFLRRYPWAPDVFKRLRRELAEQGSERTVTNMSEARRAFEELEAFVAAYDPISLLTQLTLKFLFIPEEFQGEASDVNDGAAELLPRQLHSTLLRMASVGHIENFCCGAWGSEGKRSARPCRPNICSDRLVVR